MIRRRFVLLAAAAAAAVSGSHALAAPRAIARTQLVRGPRRLLIGAPGRCAGGRRTALRLLPYAS